jgi:hypothetical protein
MPRRRIRSGSIVLFFLTSALDGSEGQFHAPLALLTRLGGPKSRSGRCGEHSLAAVWNRTPIHSPSCPKSVATPIQFPDSTLKINEFISKTECSAQDLALQNTNKHQATETNLPY